MKPFSLPCRAGEGRGGVQAFRFATFFAAFFTAFFTTFFATFFAPSSTQVGA
jgi:hypothetical protein